MGHNIGSQETYAVIGTNATAATLTAAFADNRGTFLSAFHKNLHLDVKFTPGANNQFLLLLVEYSNDYGTSAPTNFFPLTTQVPATTELDVYADSGTSMGTASGIPIVIPGDKTTTSGTAVTAAYDLEINARWVRLSVRDSGSANFGSASVYATLN